MTIKYTRLNWIIMLPLLLLHSIATGQSEKTFVKSFPLSGRQTVVLNLGENIQTTSWDNDVVRIQMTVSVPTNESTLKALAETGRYMLKSELNVQDLTVSVPGILNTVKLNGMIVKETISFLVFVPKNVTVLKNTDAKVKTVARLMP